jgi:large subunit ribosomal protein L16
MVFTVYEYDIIFNMRIPKKVKFKKYHRLNKNLFKKSFQKLTLAYGTFGLKAVEGGKITEKQIEAVRQSINKKIRPFGKVWVRCFANIPVTSKPLEVRMGKGKGSVSRWVCLVSTGEVLYEVGGVLSKVAYKALLLGSKKLPVKTKIIKY